MNESSSNFPSGLLLVNKPSGPTSYDVIRWLKRVCKGIKIGHCGTLDPLASGLLIILLGRSATKRQALYQKQDKTYRCVMRFGLQTDTGDVTGKKIAASAVPELSLSVVDSLLSTFVGEQQQIPPMYSALKVDGVPLYRLARQGTTIERKSRLITIKKMELLGVHNDEVEFRTRCSSGTYVRTLVEDIAAKMDAKATMAQLERESIGDFSIAQAISGDQLKSMSIEDLKKILKPI